IGGSRLPSTRMTAVRGSTLVPSRVTTSPSTTTEPASISSSHLRREATPDWASSFCSRIRPSSSVSNAVGLSGPLTGPSCRGRLLHQRIGELVHQVVHLGEVRRQLG